MGNEIACVWKHYSKISYMAGRLQKSFDGVCGPLVTKKARNRVKKAARHLTEASSRTAESSHSGPQGTWTPQRISASWHFVFKKLGPDVGPSTNKQNKTKSLQCCQMDVVKMREKIFKMREKMRQPKMPNILLHFWTFQRGYKNWSSKIVFKIAKKISFLCSKIWQCPKCAIFLAFRAMREGTCKMRERGCQMRHFRAIAQDLAALKLATRREREIPFSI